MVRITNIYSTVFGATIIPRRAVSIPLVIPPIGGGCLCTCRVFPLRFRGQAFVIPSAEGPGGIPAHPCHGMVASIFGVPVAIPISEVINVSGGGGRLLCLLPLGIVREEL